MLKKGLVFLLSVFCLLGVWQANSKSPLSFYGTPYETYTKQSSSLAKIFNGKTLDTTKIFYKTGESIVLSEQYENNIIELLDAKIQFTETTCNGTSVYAYSKNIKNTITVKGKDVNIQVFYGKDKTILGSPIILGSF